MLEAEMDEHLGYSKYDYQNKETMTLDIPHDREGTFETQAVKKNETDVSTMEDQVLSMYEKGRTTRDISDHLKSVYGVDVSAEMISHMTDRILPVAREWKNRH